MQTLMRCAATTPSTCEASQLAVSPRHSATLSIGTTTSWAEDVAISLRPAESNLPLALDLFAGCGGLALGFESVGFKTLGYELAEDAAATYRANLSGDCVEERLQIGTELPRAPVIIGGPPCQPFSSGGKRRADLDERNGFPAFLDAVARIQPELVIIENVPGLTKGDRRSYFLRTLQDLREFDYEVEALDMNAAAYGVPQNRKRIFIVAHRGGFKEAPPTTEAPVSVGVALAGLDDESAPEPRWLTPSMDAYVARYEAASGCRTPRDLHMDRPARTLTCRNLAGATGDMHRIRTPDGRRRRIEVREAARLQSFPDWFDFTGSMTSAFEQIGNAVPPLLARAVARQASAYLVSRGLAETDGDSGSTDGLPRAA